MKLVPLAPEHLLALEPGNRERAVFAKLGRPESVPGPGVAALEGDRVRGCGGVVLRAGAPPLGWVLLDDALRRRPVRLHRLVSRALAGFCARYGAIAASVDPLDQAAVLWIERLGFRFAGGLPGYGPDGETYWRYQTMSGKDAFGTAMFGIDTAVRLAGQRAEQSAARIEIEGLRQSADRARQLGALQMAQTRAAGDRVLAAQRARLAARGVDPSAGSGLLTLEDAAAGNEFDALLAGANAAASADRYEREAAAQSMRLRAARIGGLRSLAPSREDLQLAAQRIGLLNP